MEKIKDKFNKLGYKCCKDTKTYIEFRTSESGMRDRLKIDKRDFSITKDCTTGQGNKGHRSISYKEFLLITELIDILHTK